jgi:hypothetical protein
MLDRWCGRGPAIRRRYGGSVRCGHLPAGEWATRANHWWLPERASGLPVDVLAHSETDEQADGEHCGNGHELPRSTCATHA